MTRCANRTTAHPDVPEILRTYIKAVTDPLGEEVTVLYSTFDGPVAYLVVADELITWTPEIGWQRGPTTFHIDDLFGSHGPTTDPAEVAVTISRGAVSDIDELYEHCAAPQWDRADELPESPDQCMHGVGAVRTFAPCAACEEARAQVHTRIRQIAAGYPADVIA